MPCALRRRQMIYKHKRECWREPAANIHVQYVNRQQSQIHSIRRRTPCPGVSDESHETIIHILKLELRLSNVILQAQSVTAMSYWTTESHASCYHITISFTRLFSWNNVTYYYAISCDSWIHMCVALALACRSSRRCLLVRYVCPLFSASPCLSLFLSLCVCRIVRRAATARARVSAWLRHCVL